MNPDSSQTIASSGTEQIAANTHSAGPAAVIRRVLAVFLLIAMLLACFPLTPAFPQPNLDSAWQYALNEAVARGMVFGRDAIFTFGPWASAYTSQYHPATGHLMLIADALLGLAITAGGLCLASRSRIAYLLPVPAIIPQIGHDSLLFIPPLLFLIVSVRLTLPADHRWKLPENRQVAVALTLMTLALSLLLLMKATQATMSALAGGLGWLLLLRWRARWALLLGAIFIAGIAGFWFAAGQPLWALPGFFVAQIPIMSGYSEAMSIPGAPGDLIWYGINASLVLLAGFLFFARNGGLSGKALCLGLVLALFLVFKAAFVRHDGHALIAAEFGMLMSFFLATSVPHIAAVILIAASVITWLPTEKRYTSITAENLIASLENRWRFGHLWQGLQAQLGIGQDLRQQFEAARANIREQDPLRRVDGGADIYPLRQDLLLASGQQWSPRPIIQSYSAYEPRLADINANHLLGASAPEHVFFDIDPIDNRLATLEDGKSWPLLLTRYRVTGRAGRFLVLNRNPAVINAPGMEDIFAGWQRLGRPFNLPEVNEPIWAEIEVKPTLLGRIFTALFKPPQLHILLRYADGHTETFRYIAAMGRSGFILSPVIHDTFDFAALLMKGSEQYFSAARPASVEIAGEVGSRLFWEHAFEVRLRKIQLPVQTGAEKFVYDQFVYDQWIRDPTVNKVVGPAQCWIDTINRNPVTTQEIEAKGRLLVQGWAAVSADKGVAADEIFVTLMGDDGGFRAVRARVVPRPDVNAYFKHPEMGPVGFEALLDTADLKGTSKLQIYVKRQSQFFTCPITLEICR